jgi:hypothetical protein
MRNGTVDGRWRCCSRYSRLLPPCRRHTQTRAADLAVTPDAPANSHRPRLVAVATTSDVESVPLRRHGLRSYTALGLKTFACAAQVALGGRVYPRERLRRAGCRNPYLPWVFRPATCGVYARVRPRRADGVSPR